LSPFEQQYTDKYHPAPAYPAPATHYARGYEPKYEPKPTYGTENPAEELGEAAVDLIKFKLWLLKTGAKIVLTPFELAYSKLHGLKPEYPAPGKVYARGEYEPKPTYGTPEPNLGEELSEAAIQVLKWKLALIEAGFKLILTPAELAYNALHHPKPEYPAPKPTEYPAPKPTKSYY
jgi:hypothetical protein